MFSAAASSSAILATAACSARRSSPFSAAVRYCAGPAAGLVGRLRWAVWTSTTKLSSNATLPTLLRASIRLSACLIVIGGKP